MDSGSWVYKTVIDGVYPYLVIRNKDFADCVKQTREVFPYLDLGETKESELNDFRFALIEYCSFMCSAEGYNKFNQKQFYESYIDLLKDLLKIMS